MHRTAQSLGLRFSDESHAAGRWALANDGECYAAGVGTAIAGFRANGALIDDPIRSREAQIPNTCATRSGIGTSRIS
jgi:hypothetical protein